MIGQDILRDADFICVLNTEDELASCRFCKKIVEESRPQRPEVEVTSGRGRKPSPRRFRGHIFRWTSFMCEIGEKTICFAHPRPMKW